MARRQRSAMDLGPAVPRWVAKFHAEDWPGGFRERSTAVRDWTKQHLYRWEHYGAWIDLTRNIYVVRDELRAQEDWSDHDSVSS